MVFPNSIYSSVHTRLNQSKWFVICSYIIVFIKYNAHHKLLLAAVGDRMAGWRSLAGAKAVCHRNSAPSGAPKAHREERVRYAGGGSWLLPGVRWTMSTGRMDSRRGVWKLFRSVLRRCGCDSVSSFRVTLERGLLLHVVVGLRLCVVVGGVVSVRVWSVCRRRTNGDLTIAQDEGFVVWKKIIYGLCRNIVWRELRSYLEQKQHPARRIGAGCIWSPMQSDADGRFAAGTHDTAGTAVGTAGSTQSDLVRLASPL